MSVNDIIRAWKADGDDEDKDEDEDKAPENPAGQEMSDEDLKETAGGRPYEPTCFG